MAECRRWRCLNDRLSMVHSVVSKIGKAGCFSIWSVVPNTVGLVVILHAKLNIHPTWTISIGQKKFIIITTSTANSLHGITTSIKWNLPSRCFRWRQKLLLPNLEKPLETTPQPSPTVVEVIYSLSNPQINQADYQITRGWKQYSGNQEERSQMSAGKSKRGLSDTIFFRIQQIHLIWYFNVVLLFLLFYRLLSSQGAVYAWRFKTD